MLQTLPSISLLDICIPTIPRYTQYLIIVFCLAPLQCRFCLFQFRPQPTDITICGAAFSLRLLDRGFEISYRSIEGLELEIASGACA